MASRHVKLDGPECQRFAPVETWEELLHLHKESKKMQSSRCPSPLPGHVPPCSHGGQGTTANLAYRPPRTGSTHTHQKSQK